MLCGPCRLGSAPYIRRGFVNAATFCLVGIGGVVCVHCVPPTPFPCSGICVQFAEISLPRRASRQKLWRVRRDGHISTDQAKKKKKEIKIKAFFKTQFLLYKMFFIVFTKYI